MATRRPAVPRTPATKRTVTPSTAPTTATTAAANAPVKSKSGSKSEPKSESKPKTPLRTPVPTDQTPVPARAFSGRIVALAVVLVAITIMLAPTVRVFLGQRAEISALQADIAAKQAQQDSLKQSIARWQDENYVKQQARDRINMVMPGETAYWVFGDNGAATTGATGTTPAPAGGNAPWAQGFWESLVRAGTD